MSDTVTPQETTRLVGTGWDDHGNDTAQSVLTGTNQKVRALCLTSPDIVVPILFVPGIMGTRLKVKNRDKGSAWFPPENKWDAIVLLLKHLNKSAAERQKLLDPNNTEVDDNGPAHPDESSKALLAIAEGKTDAERAKWRGWGQLYGLSYGDILALLENMLGLIFDPASQGKQLTSTWKSLVMDRQDAEKLGAQKAFVPLQETNLRDAADVLYPVHGVGYNWLQSNRSSGQHLAQEIERITAHYRGKGKTCEKVIIVTHSMGGLVARSCAQEPGMADRILGIVHGVMPAIGAPATYKRIRAGFEGAEQVILGRNAAECTAVMANAPGPLELLPTAQYKTKTAQGTRHWLRASHTVLNGRGQPEEQDVLLGDGDPYADIYLNNGASWWKLVKEELIDPAARKELEKAKKEGKEVVEDNTRQSDFKKFKKNMDLAADLHDFINEKYHANTYAYYGADLKQPAWSEVHWRTDASISRDLKDALLHGDDLNGTVDLHFDELPTTLPEQIGGHAGATGESPHPSVDTTSIVQVTGSTQRRSEKKTRYRFKIEKAKGPGDGTVPEESGAAPTPHVVQIFRHEGKAGGHESYDHQNSYKAKIAQAATLYSITRIVAESDWVRQNLSKS
ncbi:GPI inositol-deacylase [Pseudoduganella armeniaca]|uniref:GPI inositol-deacylase n=1 Tax=Pseudoduganella armeniaca TaxID=2072590 RepID=UPI001E4D840C|nr:GPI inositol-deacylase [Pseudoduganella armeniaca]